MNNITTKDIIEWVKSMPKPYKINSLPFPREYALEMLAVLQQQIPKGVYCCDENGNCPFWELHEDKESQNNGYCHYLQIGDWIDWLDDIGLLLWDQIKSCRININDDRGD